MDEHERIVEGVLVGELSRDDEPVRTHLEGCAACRERLERLSALAGGLDSLGAEERTDLAAATQSAEDLPERFAAALDEKRVRSGPTNGLRQLRWVAAAAAVLLVVFLMRDRQPDQDDGPFLGAGREIELLEPLALPTLRWSFDLPENGYYQLRIVDDTEAGRGTIVVDSARVLNDRWSPSDSILPVTLPAAFVLTIEAFDSGGVSLTSLEERWPRSSD